MGAIIVSTKKITGSLINSYKTKCVLVQQLEYLKAPNTRGIQTHSLALFPRLLIGFTGKTEGRVTNMKVSQSLKTSCFPDPSWYEAKAMWDKIMCSYLYKQPKTAKGVTLTKKQKNLLLPKHRTYTRQSLGWRKIYPLVSGAQST